MLIHQKIIKRLRIAAILALLVQTLVPFVVGTAQAATPPWSNVEIIFNRLQASTATTGTICTKWSASNVSAITGGTTTLSVVFPAGFTVNTTVGNWTINTTSQADWPTGASALPTISAPTGGTGVVGQQVNFNFTGVGLSSAGTYCFNWTNTAAISTSTAGNNLTGSITMASGTYPGSTAQLTSNWATSVVSNDQVTVTAVVPPTFVLALSGNAQAFTANLSPSATTSTAALTATVTTNAASGYVCFVQDANFKTVTDAGSSPANRHGALTSATAAGYAISNNTASSLGTAAHTVATGSEDYGFAVTTVAQGGGGQAGTASANAAYDSTVGTKAGTLDQTQLRPFGSSNGTSNGDVFTFVERAEIAGITPAATDYTDTLTIVAAGMF